MNFLISNEFITITKVWTLRELLPGARDAVGPWTAAGNSNICFNPTKVPLDRLLNFLFLLNKTITNTKPDQLRATNTLIKSLTMLKKNEKMVLLFINKINVATKNAVKTRIYSLTRGRGTCQSKSHRAGSAPEHYSTMWS